ncbi:head maturation protease [Vibrio phage 11895-B1]|uniref:head maturation protease n=1 Tax=Vibrio phage 11895-B1 TaxID=754075 RepID=UPI0002C15C1A|nr:head maturation protease [Vibrio phage 11895-B1]AGH32091.1 hypothetical protein VPHG_00024 [Vibrio phage 11895-B1]
MSNTQPKLAIRTSSKALTTEYNIMFDSDIELQDEYHEHWYVMENASEGDVINICISSNGGSVDTIAKFQDIVKKSSAHFHAKLQGSGYSAGGALFLLCHTQEVADLSTFMAHSIQTGYGGGTQAIEAHSKMASKQNKKLCEMLYKDFLTDEEITRICDGSEIWMEAEEIRERLQQRQAIREQRVADEMKSQYTPEYYVQEILPDIAEDCEGLGYDLKQVLQMLLQSVENLEDGCTEISLDEVEDTQDIDVLKSVAKVMDLKHPHNIGIEKLRAKILNQLED